MKTSGSVMLGIGAVDRNSGYNSELDYGLSDGNYGDTTPTRRLLGLGHTMTTPANIHVRGQVNGGMGGGFPSNSLLTSDVPPVAPLTPDQGALAAPAVPPQGSCTFDESQTHDSTYGMMKQQGDGSGNPTGSQDFAYTQNHGRHSLLGQDYGLGGAGSRRSGCSGLPLGETCTQVCRQ